MPPNILQHSRFSLIDDSNIWQTGDITDIPVYTPNSISLPGGVSLYCSDLDHFDYVFKHEDLVYLLMGLDPKGRYTFLQQGEDYTHFKYKFGGRSFPQMRTNSCHRYIDDMLYVVGGLLANDGMTDIWGYDPTASVWTILGDLPSPRWSHSILFTDSRIYLFGGKARSRIDGQHIRLNDLFWCSRDDLKSWTLMDQDALLPHKPGVPLGEYNSYLYLIVDGDLWRVSDIVTEKIGSIALPDHCSDIREIAGTTYLLCKDKESDLSGDVYAWNKPDSFSLIAYDQVALTNDLSSVKYTSGCIEVDGVRKGGTSPPIDPAIPHCQRDGGRIYYDLGVYYDLDFLTMHTTSILVSTVDHPMKVAIAYYEGLVYSVGWSNGLCKVVSVDLASGSVQLIHASSNVEYREDASLAIVQGTLWLLGGQTDDKGYIYDQWKLALIDPEWIQEITLEPLPEQPFVSYTWRNRLWLIPGDIQYLYRYYPSMKQWTKVYLAQDGSEQVTLGEYRASNRWSVVDNRLMMEPKGHPKLSVNLESRTAVAPIYPGHLWLSIDRAHVVTTDGRLYISDGTEMAPTLSNQPPHFSNFGHSPGEGGSGGPSGYSLIDEHSYMMHGYDDLGVYRPAYGDQEGLFWVDPVNAIIREPDEKVGFYSPKLDYNNLLGDYKRRLPTFAYRPRPSKPLHNAIQDGSYGGSTFVASTGSLHRYRTEDGTSFRYNAPISEGSAVGLASNGSVFIFGGVSSGGGEVINQDQSGISSQSLSSATLVLYDLKYAEGEIEYLSTEPEFYTRHDYDIASSYLISRLKQSLTLGDSYGSARADKLKENYYNDSQAIIDDIAVRYVTYENGERPEGRAYPFYSQIGDKLYIGGGASIWMQKMPDPCPPVARYSAITDFHVFDMLSKTWTRLADLPCDHLFNASTIVDPEGLSIYVVGGYTDRAMTGVSTDIYVFDTVTGVWSTIPDIPSGYTGRARPALSWIDDDALMIMYGSNCTWVTDAGCPHYWFNALGDTWIYHRTTGGMYKCSADLHKSYTILPSDSESPYLELLYIPPLPPPPGAIANMGIALSAERESSDDWTAYEELYASVLKNIYDQLARIYDGMSFVDQDGSSEIITIPEFDGSKCISIIYNNILPAKSPISVLAEYDQLILSVGDIAQISDATIPLIYVAAFGDDVTRAIIFELSTYGLPDIGLVDYTVSQRAIFTVLDTISGAPYAANRISPEDILIINQYIPTGEYHQVRRLIVPYSADFSIDGVVEFFTHKNGDRWLIYYANSDLRFYRLSDRPDGDTDLLELLVDRPTSTRPLALGYDGKNHLICIFDDSNIWQLDLNTAVFSPDSNYWRRMPPALNVRSLFHNEMRTMMINSTEMLFLDSDGLVLKYDTQNFVWDIIRTGQGDNNDYVVIDGSELYYLGNDPSYFDTFTLQGDRFMINTEVCEKGIGTAALPRLTVQRNMVFGFDVNNNMVSAFVRKKGIFDRTWSFDNYYYVDRILISVDYDSLENDIEIYLRTPEGLVICDVQVRYDKEPWDFNTATRLYSNGERTTDSPEQYLLAEVQAYVSDVQVYYEPPIKDFGYVARINDVILAPRTHDQDLAGSNYFVACKDTASIDLYNLGIDSQYLVANVDDLDLAISSSQGGELASEIKFDLKGKRQTTLNMKALSQGKIVHLMVRNDPN